MDSNNSYYTRFISGDNRVGAMFRPFKAPSFVKTASSSQPVKIEEEGPRRKKQRLSGGKDQPGKQPLQPTRSSSFSLNAESSPPVNEGDSKDVVYYNVLW